MKKLIVSIIKTFVRAREFVNFFWRRKALRGRKEMEFLGTTLMGQGFMIDSYRKIDARKFKDSFANVINYLRQDDPTRHLNIIDVGANLGLFTIAFSQFENVEVFAYEPFPGSFVYLKDNVERNNLRNVHIYNYGLFDEDTVKSMGSPDAHAHRNPLTRLLKYFDREETGCKSMYHGRDNNSIMVECKRADNCEELTNLNSIDLIKIDVEGAEFNVLRGGGEMLLKKYNPILRIEFNPVIFCASGINPFEIIKFLRDVGYTHVCRNHIAPDWHKYAESLSSYIYQNESDDLVFFKV